MTHVHCNMWCGRYRRGRVDSATPQPGGGPSGPAGTPARGGPGGGPGAGAGGGGGPWARGQPSPAPRTVQSTPVLSSKVCVAMCGPCSCPLWSAVEPELGCWRERGLSMKGCGGPHSHPCTECPSRFWRALSASWNPGLGNLSYPWSGLCVHVCLRVVAGSGGQILLRLSAPCTDKGHRLPIFKRYSRL